MQKIWTEKEMSQKSSQWYNFRSKGVGGSECAPLMEMSPWTSVEDLYAQKTGQCPKPPMDDEQKAIIERGNFYEAEALAWYNKVMGSDAEPLCAVHDDFEWMRTSLDGYSRKHANVVEIKVPKNRENHYKQVSKGHIPDWRYPQIQHEIAVLHSHFPRCLKAHYVSYLPEEPTESVIIEVRLNFGFVNELMAREELFVRCMAEKRPLHAIMFYNGGKDADYDDLIDFRPNPNYHKKFGIRADQSVVDWRAGYVLEDSNIGDGASGFPTVFV